MQVNKIRCSIYRVVFVLFLTGMSGCMHTYYTPNMHQAHLLRQKGETGLTGALSTGEQVYSVELLGAHAVAKNIGLMVNANYGGGKLIEQFNDSVNQEGTRRYLIETGVGYFKPFGGQGVLELYGGGGFGSVYNYYTTDENANSTVTFTRFFLQPGIGKKGEIFDFAFSMRFVALNYQSFRRYNLPEAAWRDARALTMLEQKPFHWLYEPAVTIRAGNDFFKVQMQLGYSLKFGKEYIHQDNINSSMGISFNILPKSLR